MERFKLFFRRRPHALYWLAYGAVVGFFVWTAAQFYLPGKGFTSLILFGDKLELRRIKELKTVNYYVEEDSYGYDGQYYAQIAVKPLLLSRDLRAAMDNLPYRARRILFCWTAYGLGLGRPAWVLQAYALQNILAWLLLAWLLLRWFPPTNLSNLVRWAGAMFAWGMTMSVREALMDGPSLLLIAWGVALAEKGRLWSSACVLGISGLGRETNLLSSLSLAPGREWNWRAVWGAAGRIVVAMAPLGIWVLCLWHVYGEPSNPGLRNFAAPFEAYVGKWYETLQDLRTNGWDFVPKWTLVMLISLTVQFLVILLRPQWSSLWWRIGAAYAVLMIFLGDAVWEGYPGAAARVVVPLTLAFNVVVPRGRWWWPVLLLGNLSALSAVDQLRPPGQESYLVGGPRKVWMTPARESIKVEFPGNWYQTEKSHFEYWRWSRGPAEIVIHNPQGFPVEVTLQFDLRAFDERTVRLLQGTAVRWEGRVNRSGTTVRVLQVRLEPGDNPWRFETDKPPIMPEGDTLRPVTFNLRNFVVQAVRKLEADPPPPGPAHP